MAKLDILVVLGDNLQAKALCPFHFARNRETSTHTDTLTQLEAYLGEQVIHPKGSSLWFEACRPQEPVPGLSANEASRASDLRSSSPGIARYVSICLCCFFLMLLFLPFVYLRKRARSNPR